MHDIGWAIKQLREGKKVYRIGWNGVNQFLQLSIPDENTNWEMTLPYVFINTFSGDKVPWSCSQMDLLSTDWEVK